MPKLLVRTLYISGALYKYLEFTTSKDKLKLLYLNYSVFKLNNYILN